MPLLRGPLATPATQGLIPRGNRAKEEVKSVDTTITQPFSATAVFTVLNVPVQGAAFYNRVGTRISMKSLNIKGYLLPTASNAASTGWDYGRMALIYDRQPGAAGAGAFPAIATLLLEYASGGGTATNPWSPLNPLLRERFTIVRDKHFILPPMGIDGVATSTYAPYNAFAPQHDKNSFQIDEHIKLAGLEAHYNQTNGGTIADISTGALYLVFFSEVVAVDAAWQFNGQARLRYTDA